MKKVFANRDCIIMVLEKGESLTTDSQWLASMNRALGSDSMNSMIGRVNLAKEVWMYDTSAKRFHAWKNKGMVNEIIARMAEEGINLKVSAARIDTGTAIEVRFAENKDMFLFNLKYL